jgi:hypothetical protein
VRGVTLYVGADAKSVQGRRFNLSGPRCFSAAYGPNILFLPGEPGHVDALLDSGAFSDQPDRRLVPETALARQLAWELKARRKWQSPDFTVNRLVSYDLLIDEKWTGGVRKKERWSVAEADRAVRVTVDAAAYLSGRRADVLPRRLVLACQGVDAAQYAECVAGVLSHATTDDWIGLGGWCVLGLFRSWIPTFWTSVRKILPMIAGVGVRHVHIFGVTYLPVLGPLLWLCDRCGLTLSTDGSGPVLNVTRRNVAQSGAKEPTWEGNVRWWQDALAGLRESVHYSEPPRCDVRRQLSMW